MLTRCGQLSASDFALQFITVLFVSIETNEPLLKESNPVFMGHNTKTQRSVCLIMNWTFFCGVKILL